MDQYNAIIITSIKRIDRTNRKWILRDDKEKRKIISFIVVTVFY